ncbi:MAG: hypothetical protein IIC20_02060 [Chloroflexi bacterium]|nr:hypothetical protein [Chloroflexota bacterium]
MPIGRRKLFGAGLFVAVFGLAVVACGGSSATPTPVPTPVPTATVLTSEEAEAQYLGRVEEIAAPRRQAAGEIQRALTEGPQLRSETLARIRDTGFDVGHEEQLRAAEALTPPGTLRGDHDLYVAWLQESGIPLSRELTAKATDEDVVGAVVALIDYRVPFFRLLATVSPAFCRALGVPQGLSICDRGDDVPFGDYGERFRTLAVDLGAESQRTNALFPALRPEEGLTAVAAIQPALVQGLESILESVRKLDPPDELRQDHDRFIQAVDDLLGSARDISQAAEAQDFGELLAGLRRANLYAASLERSISPVARPLVAFLFPPGSAERAAQTVEEAGYLDSLDKAVSEINAANEAVGRALSQVYPTRDALLEAIRVSRLLGANQRLRETLGQLEPPERFREDHARLALFLEDFSRERDVDAALANEDLLQVAVDRKDFLLGYGRAAQGSTIPFCNAVAFGDASEICKSEVPGGDYGSQLREILNTYLAVEFGPRVSSFPLGLSQDEVFEALLLLNPEIEEVLAEAGDKVRALQPPERYQADHAVIVRFLDEILGVAQAITRAARDQDGEAQRAQFMESGVVSCRAVRALSDDIRPILGPHLAPNPGCSSF